MRIGDDFFRVEKLLCAETVAAWTSTDRTVEGKQPRLWIVHVRYLRNSLTHAQGRLEGFGEALAQVGPHFEAVDDGFDGVFAADIEFWSLIEFHDLAVNAGAHEPAGLQFIDQLGVLT